MDWCRSHWQRGKEKTLCGAFGIPWRRLSCSVPFALTQRWTESLTSVPRALASGISVSVGLVSSPGGSLDFFDGLSYVTGARAGHAYLGA